jgi:Arc/MetJ-type ribon-helix-helix transcriptional regulator
MTIEIKPETEQLVQEEIESGHFHSVDELIIQGVHAWRERFGARPEPLTRKPRKRLIDALSHPAFAGSELNLERKKEYPGPIDL